MAQAATNTMTVSLPSGTPAQTDYPLRFARVFVSSIIPKRTYLNICRNSTLNIIHAEGVKSTIGFM